jgi:MFS family permease
MRIRIMLVVAGVLTMGYAAGGALADPDFTLVGVLLFLAGVLAGHDAVWMLAVLAAGAAITRLVPQRHRPVVRGAAISAAALTFVAFPLVLGVGRTADNPSVLPLPYGRNLALVLLVIAAATLLTSLWRSRRARSRKESERPGEGSPRPAGR